MQRPNEQEFLRSVVQEIEDLPAGFADRLLEVVTGAPGDRADAIRTLFQDAGRG